MPCTESTYAARKVASFYDDLAPNYDHEQFQTTVALAKRTEWALVTARLPELFTGAARVLEVGAGTGIFTIPIARQCRQVTAVDLSRNMLNELERKAAAEGITNIRTILGNVEQNRIEGTFSVICAFSSLEYIADLPQLVNTLAGHLEPGGVLYCITARRSFLRHFIQLGNAVRQGIWLRARSRRGMETMLRAAGFDRIEISSHLLTVFGQGGMLLEVVARRGGSDAATENGRE
jgi:peptidoglycan-N-acetylglucosamine deacetylase